MNSAPASASGPTHVIVLLGLPAGNVLAAMEPGIVALMHQVGVANPVAGRILSVSAICCSYPGSFP